MEMACNSIMTLPVKTEDNVKLNLSIQNMMIG